MRHMTDMTSYEFKVQIVENPNKFSFSELEDLVSFTRQQEILEAFAITTLKCYWMFGHQMPGYSNCTEIGIDPSLEPFVK